MSLVDDTTRRLARLALSAVGWRTEGTLPEAPRMVLIAAPHTSNWDAVLLLLAARVFGIELQWFVKDSWFFFPFGAVMRGVGGVPIDRTAPRGIVEQAIAQLAASERMVLAVPPEGTRGQSAYWKTGFYRIAVGAKVPIVLGYLDYRRKVAGLGPLVYPTGDMHADFEIFRDFYSKVTARFPEKVGAIAPADADEAGRGAR
jgi:1-acyl-sn-glycerol-3-phosphate acyltransferase